MLRAGSCWINYHPYLCMMKLMTRGLRVVKVEEKEPFQVALENGVWMVTGPTIDRLVQKRDLSNEANMEYFLHVIRKLGVEKVLREKGVKNGDTVNINGWEFEFME